jgi:hypothetical protein
MTNRNGQVAQLTQNQMQQDVQANLPPQSAQEILERMKANAKFFQERANALNEAIQALEATPDAMKVMDLVLKTN